MQPEKEDWQAPTGTVPTEYHAPVDDTAPAEAELPMAESATSAAREAFEGDEELVRWQASEYIQRDKDGYWYVGLAVMSVLLMIVAIFLMKSWTFAVLIPVMAAALVVYARRPPAVHSYVISRKGLHIDDQLYPFVDFREFGLLHGDDEYAVMLVPRKRFVPGVTVYFPEESGEAIVDMLAVRLPMKEIHLDLIDRVTRFLRI